MRKITIKLMLAALIAAPSFSYAQDGEYTLKGKFTSQKAPTKVYMMKFSNGQNNRDSAIVKNGMFELKGKVDGPTYSRLFADHSGQGFSMRNGGMDMLNFYLDKGTITLNATDSIKNAKITGSKINDEFAKYNAALPQPKSGAVMATRMSGGSSPEARKAAEEKRAAQIKFIKENPNSYFSLEALTEIAGSNIDADKYEPMFKSLSPELQASTKGHAFAAGIKASRSTGIGAMAMDFTQNDVNGKPVKLSDFRGQYVLIDFWASWCGPCRAENPHVVKAYNNYKDKNFTILGVSLDNPGKKDAWLEAIKKDGLPWTQVSDLQGWKNAASTLYGVRAIPANFLVDPQGKIVARNLRGQDLEKKLAELLDK